MTAGRGRRCRRAPRPSAGQSGATPAPTTPAPTTACPRFVTIVRQSPTFQVDCARTLVSRDRVPSASAELRVHTEPKQHTVMIPHASVCLVEPDSVCGAGDGLLPVLGRQLGHGLRAFLPGLVLDGAGAPRRPRPGRRGAGLPDRTKRQEPPGGLRMPTGSLSYVIWVPCLDAASLAHVACKDSMSSREIAAVNALPQSARLTR